MPANSKYLTNHKGHRFAKISAGILGGFLITAGTMLAIASWTKAPKNIFISFVYLIYIEWCALILVAFLFKSGLKCWAWYGATIMLLAAIYLLGKNFSS